MSNSNTPLDNRSVADDRRTFLQNCGKFAITVPPAMTVLMSTSLASPAIALSSGEPTPRGNNGIGNGDQPPPGQSGESEGHNRNPPGQQNNSNSNSNHEHHGPGRH